MRSAAILLSAAAVFVAGQLSARAGAPRAEASAESPDLRIARLEESVRRAHESVDLLAGLTHERFERLKQSREHAAPDVARALLHPSVQVNAKGGAGGGTIVYSRPEKAEAYGTYVLTAFHVVAKSVHKDEHGREQRRTVAVTVYRADGSEDERIESDLLAWNEKRDVALLRLRSSRPFAVARLAGAERLSTIAVFTRVTAVGCPLGHDPLPSQGEITTLRKDVQGERFWMMSAPTIFGNSGGGVFERESLEFIGVSAMLCTFDNPGATPVPHMGILIPLASIRQWLATTEYGYVVVERREW